jgi:hypothetical protein
LALTVAATLATAAGAQTAIYSNARTTPTDPGLATGATTASGVAAPAGMVWSEVQAISATEANAVAGFAGFAAGPLGAPGSPTFRFADDVTIPAGGGWRVQALRVYAYLQNAPAGPTPFTGASLRVWAGGAPGQPSASVVFGDALTSVMTAQVPTDILRVFSTSTITSTPTPSSPDTTRQVWAIDLAVAPELILAAGQTYWLDWQLDTTGDAQAFAPAITVVGQRTRSGAGSAPNALQYRTSPPPALTGSWLTLLDAGKPAHAAPDVAQDLPFVVFGAVLPTPCGASDIASPGPIAGADGEVTADDIILYVSWFTSGDARADVAGPGPTAGSDGEFTADDLILFINRFVSAC